MNVLVITTDIETNEVVNACVIDYTIADNRRWLAKHCFYAYNNGLSITTEATTELPNFRKFYPKKDQ